MLFRPTHNTFHLFQEWEKSLLPTELSVYIVADKIKNPSDNYSLLAPQKMLGNCKVGRFKLDEKCFTKTEEN